MGSIPQSSNAHLPYRIAVLVFVQDPAGRQLLLHRAKAPNLGLWSPIGGKLEMATGESPFECARRETFEEIGLEVADSDLHLFAMIAEKAYEGSGHWLLFLFHCRKPCPHLPPAGQEGSFAYFSREEIDSLPLPHTDRTAIWPLFDRHKTGFACLRASCAPGDTLSVQIEQEMPDK
jgi:8-oxo-dGTP diphosphatase